MRFAVAAVCAALAVCALAQSWGPMGGEELAQFLQYPGDESADTPPSRTFARWIDKLHPYLESIVTEEARVKGANGEYFAWIPNYLGYISPTT